jgi:hypothetical protein
VDYFKVNLHANIAYRFWSPLKGHPNYMLVIFKMTFHVGIAFRLGLHLKLLKSPMGYIETNSNMGIAFRVRHSYNFVTIPTTYLFSPTKNLALIS